MYIIEDVYIIENLHRLEILQVRVRRSWVGSLGFIWRVSELCLSKSVLVTKISRSTPKPQT